VIKVTNAITYEIRDENGRHPVFITINANGHSCHFAGSGDYGDYSYYWGSMGSGYKEFLSSLDYDYMMNKITGYHGSAYELDVKESRVSLKREMLSYYRVLLEDDMDNKSSIREELEDIFRAIDNITDFNDELYYETRDIIVHFSNFFIDGVPGLKYIRNAQCEGFWRQFKKLCEFWEEELKDVL